jgi:predicted component of type VI protein secretion system
MAHLYFILKNTEQPSRILVWDTRTLSIGRSPENDLPLDDEEVSRKHAHLTNENGRFEVGDYRTGNGTFVNGKRVSQKAPFKPGDVIAVGKLQLEFCQSEEHPAKLGLKADFASHLKTMGMMPQGEDANATMLGLSDTAPPDEEFVIEPERGSGGQAFVVGDEVQQGFQMRELEDSLNGMQFEMDDALDLTDTADDIPPPPETRTLDLDQDPAPASAPAAAPADDPTTRLRKLKALLDEGLISEEEFQAKRAAVLDSM